MSDLPSTNAIPQFNTAEYPRTPGTERCSRCDQVITHRYYRINGAMVCPGCAELAKFSAPKNQHALYVRALLFGIAAAVGGLILYAAFAIMTGWIIGYVSLAVGYMVGKSMMFGSKGIGGRRYQITAMLLTYAAVSMAAVPITLSLSARRHAARAAYQQKLQEEQQQFENESGQQSQLPAPPPKPKINLAGALASLALLGLASPLLRFLRDPLHGAIGIIILLVGIRIAWSLTAGKPVDVSGPFENSSAASA
jgi:hypothetical protein